MRHVWSISVISYLLFLPAVALGDGPFASMTFDEARKKARAEKKLVFIDYYADWCMPCKMMDATTFSDAKVLDFLKNKVIALKIDGEKHAKLATKHHVNGFPTLVFVRPDGGIAEVLGGYLDAAGFLGLAENALAGKDTLTRFKEALKRSPDDPTLHVLVAEALAGRGEYRDALEHCRFVLEKADLDIVAADMVPAVVMQLLALSQFSADAETLLNRLYDSARTAVVEQKATNAQIALYAAVPGIKGDATVIVATYDLLLTAGAKPEYLQRITALWKTTLVAAERYQDIARHVNIVDAAADAIANLRARKPGELASNSMFDPETLARNQRLGSALAYYRVLTALGRHPDADALARRLVKLEESLTMYNMLAWTAYETGRVTETHLAYARKAYEMAGGKDVGVVDTLARVLHRLGRKDEAIKLVTDALEWAQPGFERNFLRQCLIDIGP